MFEGIYERQKNLEIRKIYSATIAGLGGVGSWVSLLLALSGSIEKITLVDPDKVEIHNLNRTPYRFNQIGKYKSTGMAEIISERRPNLIINPVIDYIENRLGLLEESNLFVDCRDRVDTLSEKSPILVGYDKDSISISIGFKNDKIFDSEYPSSSYTGAWVIPPVIGASLIVHYLLREQWDNERTVNRTLTISELLNLIKEA